MVQILPEETSFGGEFGRGFGAGILELMSDKVDARKQEMAERRQSQAQRLQQQQQAEALQQIGLPPELAFLSPQLQQQFLKNQQAEQKQSVLMELLMGGGVQGQQEEVAAEEVQGPRGTTEVAEMAEEGPTSPAPSGQPYSQQQIAVASLLDPTIARQMQSANESAQREQHFLQQQQLSERKFAAQEKERVAARNSKVSDKFVEEIGNIGAEIPAKQRALQLMKNAVKEGTPVDRLSAILADMSGKEYLRTANAAQFVNGLKEFFLGSLSKAGSRPNQWIERQIAAGLADYKRTGKANEAVLAAMQAGVDIEEATVQIGEDLFKTYEENLGYVPKDIKSQVNKQVAQFAKDRNKQLEEEIRAIKGGKGAKGKSSPTEAMEKVEIILPDGRRGTITEDKLEIALKQGAKRA